MEEKKKGCCWEKPLNFDPCGRELYDDKHCIFHSKDVEGKKAEFDDLFQEEYERQVKEGEGFDFIGFVFPGDISFDGKEFKKDVSFWIAEFSGKADFKAARFSGRADFSIVKFSGEAVFRGAEFSGYTFFSGTRFNGDTHFHSAQFPGKAIFESARFLGETDFNNARFPGGVDFSEAGFSGEAVFRKALFPGEAVFSSARFSGKTFFNSARFTGKADFLEAQFSGDASFRDVQFTGEAGFDYARFTGDAVFNSARFSGDAGFINALFSGQAYFLDAQFTGEAYFNSAQFFRGANFENVTFYKRAVFDKARFKEIGGLDMSETFFYDVSGLLEILEKDKEKRGVPGDEKTEFLSDNIRIILGEKSTARYPIISRQIQDDRYLLRFREKHPKLHFLWWLLADCGRSFARWALWSIFFAVLFALVFQAAGSEAFKPKPEGYTWFSFVYYSIVTFTTLGFGDITPIKWYTEILVTLEVILGYIMLGGLISILANKLARRS